MSMLKPRMRTTELGFLQHYPIPEVVFAGFEHYQREADGFPLKKQQMGVIIVCQILLFLMEARKR